jgi:hypothetical protein
VRERIFPAKTFKRTLKTLIFGPCNPDPRQCDIESYSVSKEWLTTLRKIAKPAKVGGRPFGFITLALTAAIR